MPLFLFHVHWDVAMKAIVAWFIENPENMNCGWKNRGVNSICVSNLLLHDKEGGNPHPQLFIFETIHLRILWKSIRKMQTLHVKNSLHKNIVCWSKWRLQIMSVGNGCIPLFFLLLSWLFSCRHVPHWFLKTWHGSSAWMSSMDSQSTFDSDLDWLRRV